MSLIEIHHVTKVYRSGPEEVVPLKNLSFSIEEGEFVALMGPSGSGKTTLLNLIAGIDQPTQGSVVVAGEEISALNARELARWRTRHVGFVFQNYNLIPVLTAFENVEVPLLLLDMSRSERRKRVMVALEAVDLADRAGHLPRQMSGGQQQRVAIARALVGEPSLILADEPTGNLDSSAADDFAVLLRDTVDRWGRSILLVTHDPRISSYADRILHMKDGQISEETVNGKREVVVEDSHA